MLGIAVNCRFAIWSIVAALLPSPYAVSVIPAASTMALPRESRHSASRESRGTAKHAPLLMRSENIHTSASLHGAEELPPANRSAPPGPPVPSPLKPFTVQIFYGSMDKAAFDLIGHPSCNLYSRTEVNGTRWRWDLYPYGLTTSEEHNETAFPHGRQERWGNAVHQCALNVLGKEQGLSLITCMMTAERMGVKPSVKFARNVGYTYPSQEKTDGVPKSFDYRSDVQDLCVLETMMQPDWKELLDACTNDPVRRAELEHQYEVATEHMAAQIDGNYPAVFVNGTLVNATPDGDGLCKYLDVP